MNVTCPHVVVLRHDQERQCSLRMDFPIAGADRSEFARDAVGTERAEKLELPAPRGFGAPIGEIDDVALDRTFDGAVRLFDKAL